MYTHPMPNNSDSYPNWWRKSTIFAKTTSLCAETTISPDNSLDNSSHTSRLNSPMGFFIKNKDLYDVWRCHHTTEHDYSFFHHHNPYTRIDYFLVDKLTLPKVSESAISTITWSDHAPGTMTSDNSSSTPRTKIWRANASIIHSPVHSAYIRECLEEFFKLNKGTASNNTILWNAHKAFIRGIIIQLSAREKRKISQHLDTFTTHIKTLENQNQTNADPALKADLLCLSQELSVHLLESFEKSSKAV